MTQPFTAPDPEPDTLLRHLYAEDGS